ncbi:hypothetical protein FKM82_004893 [Ascaphus truei]
MSRAPEEQISAGAASSTSDQSCRLGTAQPPAESGMSKRTGRTIAHKEPHTGTGRWTRPCEQLFPLHHQPKGFDVITKLVPARMPKEGAEERKKKGDLIIAHKVSTGKF